MPDDLKAAHREAVAMLAADGSVIDEDAVFERVAAKNWPRPLGG